MIRESAEYDVLVVGGTGMDAVVRVGSLPVPLADSVQVGPIEEWPGHTGANVALGTRALGLVLGVPVSTDLHDWDGLADHHREFALRSDLVFLSAAGAGDNTPVLMRQILREGRADTVVATAGAEGSYLLTRDGGSTPHHLPAVAPNAPVVDTNGAGDAYVSGFLYGRLTGRDVRECGRFGAVAGAHACTAPVATDPISRKSLLAADQTA